MTDAKLQMMMADVGEVLTRYHATVREVLVCGEMMLLNAVFNWSPDLLVALE